MGEGSVSPLGVLGWLVREDKIAQGAAPCGLADDPSWISRRFAVRVEAGRKAYQVVEVNFTFDKCW